MMEINLIKQAEKNESPSKAISKTSSYNDIHSAESLKSIGSKARRFGIKIRPSGLDLSYDQTKKTKHRSKQSEVLTHEACQLPPLLSDFSYCSKCKRTKPPRTHHCRRCDRCILRMDHHCPWLGNCIGFDNHKYFVLTLYYYCIFIIYTTCCLSLSLINARNVYLTFSYHIIIGRNTSLHVPGIHHNLRSCILLSPRPADFPRLLTLPQHHHLRG